MADFATKELSSDAPLGAQLKEVRDSAGLTLEQVAVGTKIRKQFLEALEEGHYDVFPAEVYARGFLENYAGFLGFPVDQVMLQYRRERGISAPAKEGLKLPGERHQRQRITINPRTLGIGGIVFALLIAASYIITQLTGFTAPPELEVFKPAATSTVATESVEVDGRTDIGATVSINNQPVPIDPDGRFTEKVQLLPGTNVLRITARRQNGKTTTIARSVVLQAPGLATAAPTAQPANGFLFTIQIGPNSSYVTVNVDGKDVFQGLLVPNTQQTFNAIGRVLLTTSNAGSTKVVLNGVAQPSLGAEGQLRRGVEFLAPTPAPAAPSSAAPTPR